MAVKLTRWASHQTGQKYVEIKDSGGNIIDVPWGELNDMIRALLKELNTDAAPQLMDSEPLVLYFGSDADRDEMIAVCKGSFKNLRSIKV